MNILGHENPEAPHLEDENPRVDASPPPVSSRAVPSRSRATDADIVEAARRRDRNAAAGLLVEAHAVPLGRACMALLGSQSEAEDALQETLLDALRGLEGFRGEGSMRAWLLAIARRRCARRLEARGRERQLAVAVQAPSTPASAEELSLARRARSLLSEVRPSEREALVLRFESGLSFREVGEACGIDEAAARKRVSRGLSRLRALLAEDES